MKPLLSCIILLSTLLLHPSQLLGQSRDKVYAVFLLNFARHIEWPDQSTETFIIGVLDYDPLVSELKDVARIKKIGKQRIVVSEFESVGQVTPCNILFIPESRAGSLTSIIGKFPYTPTLIITEKEGLAEKGSNINLLTIDGKIKFQINNQAMNGRGLKVSEELLSFAMSVQ